MIYVIGCSVCNALAVTVMPWVLVIVIVGFVGMGTWARNREKKAWNNGVSPTGEDWECFDMASDGSRGYKDSEFNTIWISYNVDKRK